MSSFKWQLRQCVSHSLYIHIYKHTCTCVYILWGLDNYSEMYCIIHIKSANRGTVWLILDSPSPRDQFKVSRRHTYTTWRSEWHWNCRHNSATHISNTEISNEQWQHNIHLQCVVLEWIRNICSFKFTIKLTPSVNVNVCLAEQAFPL